ncbi:unnamed protein product [Schistocephalus solidus]|uniref:LisH domain-containing protein n=1 Tax=Schistocephalus solidus TaxID=70667 RepID=A0A183TLL9_SCHSO|nr:unnamed protein product [Schistocephalus solidus]
MLPYFIHELFVGGRDIVLVRSLFLMVVFSTAKGELLPLGSTFVEDLSNVASYINMGSIRSMSDSSVDPAPESLLYKSADNMSREELFATIIIEDLIRNGYGPVAIQLAREVGLSEEDIGFKHFCEIGEMVAALRFGKLEPAKSWLAKHCDSLGVKARQLEYVLAKLDFLMRVQQCVDKPTAVLEYMRSFVPYAKEFPAGLSVLYAGTPPPHLKCTASLF